MGDRTVPLKEPPRGVTFEDVWAMMQETDREIKELLQSQKETDRKMKATDRQMKETDRKMKETDRKLGDLGLRLGEITEHLMSPKLHKKFETLGFSFNHISRDHGIRDHKDRRLAEIDVLLENGEYAMVVEVKTRPTVGDVKDHVKRMEVLRRVADEHGDRRKYLGALAGAVVNERVLAYALKNGFYVIIPSGETVDIEAPEGFSPRIW
jgi:hypothetical protein